MVPPGGKQAALDGAARGGHDPRPAVIRPGSVRSRVMHRTWLAAGLLLLSGAGCAGMNNTEAGALGGGDIGAGLGTVVGGISGHPLAGAAIGGAGGALLGGAVGNSEDRRERREVQAANAWAAQNQMTLTDVVSMTQQHISDTIIIQQMDTTYSN